VTELSRTQESEEYAVRDDARGVSRHLCRVSRVDGVPPGLTLSM